MRGAFIGIECISFDGWFIIGFDGKTRKRTIPARNKSAGLAMSAFRSVCCTGGSNVPVAHEPDAVSFAVAGEANRRCRIVCLEGASDRDLQRAFRLAVSWPISWIEVMYSGAATV